MMKRNVYCCLSLLTAGHLLGAEGAPAAPTLSPEAVASPSPVAAAVISAAAAPQTDASGVAAPKPSLELTEAVIRVLAASKDDEARSAKDVVAALKEAGASALLRQVHLGSVGTYNVDKCSFKVTRDGEAAVRIVTSISLAKDSDSDQVKNRLTRTRPICGDDATSLVACGVRTNKETVQKDGDVAPKIQVRKAKEYHFISKLPLEKLQSMVDRAAAVTSEIDAPQAQAGKEAVQALLDVIKKGVQPAGSQQIRPPLPMPIPLSTSHMARVKVSTSGSGTQAREAVDLNVQYCCERDRSTIDFKPEFLAPLCAQYAQAFIDEPMQELEHAMHYMVRNPRRGLEVRFEWPFSTGSRL